MIEDLTKKKYYSIIALFLERLPKCIIVRFAKHIEIFLAKQNIGQESKNAFPKHDLNC